MPAKRARVLAGILLVSAGEFFRRVLTSIPADIPQSHSADIFVLPPGCISAPPHHAWEKAMKDEESKGRSEETESQSQADAGVSRRSFLQAGALAAGGAALAPLAQAKEQSDDAAAQDVAGLGGGHGNDVANSSIAELQSLMSSHRLSAQQLLDIYLRRIEVIDER
ncbi:MAG TPA: twin-arginine translocation signal domain-containing protein, partial [Steroidobacteraceae bacterium]|nr:twin-arginine translocation signal domain-containing protein [Steroidobacteraceae bacterium]